jgi:16S rRNA (cytosine967-C5)-methyltransferase
VLAPRAGERVLDACAGVGGKATHIAALQGDRGEVACVDPSARKLELLREHCLRLGVSSCVTVGGDLRAVELGGELDRVLVDAPCSGLGVLRRHPELRWRLELERVAELVSLQRELLAAAAHRLARGGVLVYAVCTLTPEEGPEQVRWLLEARPDLDLEREPIELPAPAGADGELAAQARGGELTIWPQRHEGDGFFIARLRRRG